MAYGQQETSNPFYGQVPNYQHSNPQEALLTKASPPVSRASVPNTVASLAGEVESLHKIISTIEDRLMGTLLPAPVSETQIARNTVNEAGSPLRDHLCSILGEVRRISQRLHELSSRLDL